MPTTTAEEALGVDPRPLHIRFADTIKSDEFKTNAAAVAVGAGGALAYSGTAYLGYVVSIAFLNTISVPAWVLTLAYWSGAFSVVASALSGFWLGYRWVKNEWAF